MVMKAPPEPKKVLIKSLANCRLWAREQLDSKSKKSKAFAYRSFLFTLGLKSVQYHCREQFCAQIRERITHGQALPSYFYLCINDTTENVANKAGRARYVMRAMERRYGFKELSTLELAQAKLNERGNCISVWKLTPCKAWLRSIPMLSHLLGCVRPGSEGSKSTLKLGQLLEKKAPEKIFKAPAKKNWKEQSGHFGEREFSHSTRQK